MRISLSLVLSLALVLIGQSMAVARGMAPAADEIVICTGSGPVVMTVDAEGNPTAPSHICPDCTLNLLQALLNQGLALISFASWQKVKADYAEGMVACSGPNAPQARDPPRAL